jgi:hypothetical protein
MNIQFHDYQKIRRSQLSDDGIINHRRFMFTQAVIKLNYFQSFALYEHKSLIVYDTINKIFIVYLFAVVSKQYNVI